MAFAKSSLHPNLIRRTRGRSPWEATERERGATISRWTATLHPLPGDNSCVEPPDPIPNSEVRSARADGSVHLACESRSSPGSLPQNPAAPAAGFFFGRSGVWSRLPPLLQDLRGLAADDDDVRAALREQPDADHARDLVDGRFHRRRVADLQAMDVQDPVAVVGGDPLAPHGLSAGELDQLARDQAAGHGNHLDRQRELAEHVDALGRIADADELRAGPRS